MFITKTMKNVTGIKSKNILRKLACLEIRVLVHVMSTIQIVLLSVKETFESELMWFSAFWHLRNNFYNKSIDRFRVPLPSDC